MPEFTEIILLARRIHGASPKVLELMELSSHHNAHRNGLHVLFDDELSPFACVIPSLVAGKSGYIVWVVTVRGVVYRMRLLGAAGSWMLCGEPQQHEVHGELPRLQSITTFAATPEMLCLGGESGSIICISLGTSSHTSPPGIVLQLVGCLDKDAQEEYMFACHYLEVCALIIYLNPLSEL